MPDIGERIMTRVEHKFDKNENLFFARSLMARIALVFTPNEGEIIADTNERIVRFLKDRHAEGVVYATREDLGNGKQDSTDFVMITSRDGQSTSIDIAVGKETLEKMVIRTSTEDVDY
ncbi:MAG: hypothetical protein WAV04_01955 [Candidatus Microsaccharimonas sp.]